MNCEKIYEKQYSQKKLINVNTFQHLRKVFKRFDVNREDLALSLIDGGRMLLDVGCGNGSLVIRAKDKFQEVYGIDISTFRIEEARKKAADKLEDVSLVHFSTCNINNKVEFPDNTFDAAISLAVVEHVFDPYFVVGEINRVLKPGGIFIVDVPNIAYIRYRLALLFGKLPVTSSPFNWKEIGWDGGHLHYFTKKSLVRLLEESGFTILKVTGCGLFAKFRNFYPALLTGDICIKARKE